jgi:hypothetical protein
MNNCVYTAMKYLFGGVLTEEQDKKFKELIIVTDFNDGVSLHNLYNFVQRANLHLLILNRDLRFNAAVKRGIHIGKITKEGKVDPAFLHRLDMLALNSYKSLRAPFVLMSFTHAIFVRAMNEDGTFSYIDQDGRGKKHFFDALSQGYLIVVTKGTNTVQGGGGIIKKIDYQE